jgi:DNA-directed RNA polymerase subunit RPC12/RpoP
VSSAATVLRCPHCGAPVEVVPFAATTRCGYCGHTIQLAQPQLQPPARPLAGVSAAAPRARTSALAVRGGAVALIATLSGGASLIAFMTRQREPAPVAVSPPRTLDKRAAPAGPSAPAARQAAPAPVGFPLGALLGVNPKVDIDGSRAHLLGLFPGISSEARADQLQYTVPLRHPWFSAAELNWKNEKDGPLVSVALRPPKGDPAFKNQNEIADCLARGLGKPQIKELNHLAGELSYFWGSHFPKAWADLYSSYLWLAFEAPQGVAPVTFSNVVRTLDGCSVPAP